MKSKIITSIRSVGSVQKHQKNNIKIMGKKLFFITVLSVSCSFGFSQGCSDAGICSIGKGFDSDEKEVKNNIEVAAIFGTGDANITYISPYIAYTKRFNDKFSLSTKVTFSSANGDFGTRAAFGDAYLIGNYTFKEVKEKQWSALAGWKFPFTSSNLKINGFALPLDYQSSLGTFDLFLGTNLKYKKWDFNAAIQIPVFNNNQNSYFDEFSASDDFPTTNLFERKSDALFRTMYTIKLENSKFTFKPNVLFIYHLGEDTFENQFGERQTIAGSDGLTINGNLISVYQLNNRNSIELSLAAPFLIREIRPDGLTRGFVAGINYRISF
ncbi:hypothetical protein [Flavobacterium sp.]|jgi:hypothetical protein|uniref:hypothetical protein n=1 Tax=Flavobacterium sp. TaxID=239 RepID=UPI0037C09F89